MDDLNCILEKKCIPRRPPKLTRLLKCIFTEVSLKRVADHFSVQDWPDFRVSRGVHEGSPKPEVVWPWSTVVSSGWSGVFFKALKCAPVTDSCTFFY